MKTRTSLILALVALGLIAFIFFYESDLATTSELEERSDRVLADFARTSVDRIVIGEGDERIELIMDEPTDDAGPEGAVGTWRLTHPIAVDADEEAVDGLLSALDWLERRRLIEEDGATSRPQFGLTEARARITFRLRGREVTLMVGSEAPGNAVYLAIDGEDDRVYAVDEEFLEAITKEPGELRNKSLSPIRVANAEAVRVVGSFHAVRLAPEQWELRTPVRMRADVNAVEDVIRNLERLRATRFIADDVGEEDLGQYGLDNPRREVRATLSGEEDGLVLRFGGACEGHGEEVYVTRLGSGTVACVNGEALEVVSVEATTLRDMRLARVRADDLEAITIVVRGSELTLHRDDGEWQIGEGDEAVTAETQAVEELIDALRDATAETIEDDLEAAALAGDDADIEIRLRREGEGAGADILRFARSSSSEDKLLARRGSEDVALVLPAALSEHLSAESIRYRQRRILSEDGDHATTVEISGAEATRQVLRRSEGAWRLTTPFEARADETIMGDLVRAVARLRATRFVASAPSSEHGLGRPRAILQVTFEAGAHSADGGATDGGSGTTTTHTLKIGAPAGEGEVYAQLEGEEVVFVISDAFASRALEPLIDRDSLAVDDSVVEQITIERSGQRVELRLRGDQWFQGEDAAPAGTVERLLTRLASARASEVIGYGAPADTMGLTPPNVRVTMRLDDEEERTPEVMEILVGASYEEDEQPRAYVRRGDLDATFGLPARTVELILDYGVTADM